MRRKLLLNNFSVFDTSLLLVIFPHFQKRKGLHKVLTTKSSMAKSGGTCISMKIFTTAETHRSAASIKPLN